MPCLDKILCYLCGRIYFNWLLFCITGFFLSSCSSRSVRTGLSSLTQNRHKVEKTTEAVPAESLSEFSELPAPPDKNADRQETIVETKPKNAQLAALSKQLRLIENNHDSLDGKVNDIHTDIADLRNSIEEIKDAIMFYHEGKKDVAQTGPEDLAEQSIKETYMDEADEFIILPDEALEKKTSVKKPSPKPKRRKISKSGAAHPQQKQGSTAEKVNLLPSGYSAGNERTLSPELKDALKYFTRKNYHKAINRLIEIVNIEQDPVAKSDCNYWLGESHFGLKQFDKAIIFFIKVVDNVETPKRDDAQIMIAESYVRSGKIDLAKEAFTKLVTIFTKSEYNPRARKMLQQL